MKEGKRKYKDMMRWRPNFRASDLVRLSAMAFIALTLPTGCADERLEMQPEGPGGPAVEKPIDGYSLAFNIKLDKDLGTRAAAGSSGAIILDGKDVRLDESMENWIDSQDKFRVFFFTKEGEFLFGAIDRTVSSLESNDFDADYWHVRIPMNVLVDRNGHEYPVDRIKDYLKHNEFKVAVLANWPNFGERVYPGDYDDSDENVGKDNPVSTLKGHPIWGFRNSVLYDPTGVDADVADIVGSKNVKNINDLHHIYEDEYYLDTSQSSGRPSRFQCYSPFMQLVEEDNADGTTSTFRGMGQASDWVQYRSLDEGWHWPDGRAMDGTVPSFTTKETANAWIRANCTPDITLNEEKKIYRHYQHLWFLWNFDASYKTGRDGAAYTKTTSNGKTYYHVSSMPSTDYYANNFGWNDGSPASVANPWARQWFERNGAELYEWMKASLPTTASTPTANLTTKTIQIGSDANGVKFACYGSGHKAVKMGNYYGIQLASQGSTKPTDSKPGNSLHFIARTSGTVRVKWSSSSAGTTAQLTVQKNSGSDAKPDKKNSNSTTPQDYYSSDSENFLDISVGDSATPSVYIYSPSGNAVVYSIEFIRGKYLNDTDREGVLPSHEQGIPMYGVQNFRPLRDWEYGSTYEITSEGNEIFLLRSLAKVEFYVPKSFGRLHHVYLKSSNRIVRCEPMDVETPTREIWNDNHYSSATDLCEWFTIYRYGACFDSAKGTDLADYLTWLSWFYTSWKTASWNVTDSYTVDNEGKWTPNTSPTGFSFSGVSWSNSSLTPPRIFNPAINRSDFCSFIFAGEDDGGNYKYVIYTPEKYTDDPTNMATRNSTPKVPHIEFRFSPTNSAAGEYSNTEFNLDDNDTHRVYFTNYGNHDGNAGLGNTAVNSAITDSSMTLAEYDNYEKNTSHLNMHWPIMRNHVYQFYLSGTGPESFTVNAKVREWGYEKVIVDW